MSDVGIGVILLIALAAAVYVTTRVARVQRRAAPAAPPGAPAGTLALGQYAVQPGASWLLLTPGAA